MQLDSSIAAIVTGGASGLGEATARRLASHGVRVALFDLDEARGTRVAGDIGGLFCKTDVTSEASVADALKAARSRHGIERIAVNCAGIAPGKRIVLKNRETGALAPQDLASFSKVVSVNLIGTFNVLAQSAAGMAGLEPLDEDGSRGVIVNTASVAAEDGQVGQAAYAASKGAVKALTLPAARDLSQYGIRVVAILPGIFHTPMFDSIAEDFRKTLAAAVPFPQRLGRPDEYAHLVEFICRNGMLNGETIRLDGAIRMAPR
ncbi:MAG TPA: SDR family NAD(P)-dependent oxidoreductase [Beijerinckiaceae bacterium]|nr:SDR family NAD(P)-dependent oxidoreductase [Beijerinckiaceae bacterium]